MKNSVELIGYYGGDDVIACSAWTSTNRTLTDEKRDRIDKMINTLWKEGHHSPFEKGIVHFLVNTDIASHIHLLKHRISSLNSESARYKEMKDDKYYLPPDWNVDIMDETEGMFEIMNHYNKHTWIGLLEASIKQQDYLYHAAIKDLEGRLGRKRAKESARYFKTYAMQYEADVMFNMRSFANLIKLRKSEHAQKEIMEITNTMLHLVASIEGNPFKHTLAAWGFKVNKEILL